jgi:hypothetical protein
MFAIFLAILFSSRHEPERRRFKRFEVWCFVAAAFIVALWAVTGSSFWAFIFLQALMCVGYGPTLMHLLRGRRVTEPFDVWSVNLLLGFISLVPALLSRYRDWLAIIYAVRATLCVSAILSVMWYFHRKTRNLPR